MIKQTLGERPFRRAQLTTDLDLLPTEEGRTQFSRRACRHSPNSWLPEGGISTEAKGGHLQFRYSARRHLLAMLVAFARGGLAQSSLERNLFGAVADEEPQIIGSNDCGVQRQIRSACANQ